MQITHHIFMLVPLAAAAACFLRAGFSASPVLDFVGGLMLGLALWISPETMPLVLAFAAMRAAVSLQEPRSGALWPVAIGLLMLLLAAWLTDPPPPTFTAWALDHMSFSWLFFGGLLSGLLLLADCCVLRNVRLSITILWLTLALVLAASCWLVLVPGALAGPNGLIPDELRILWYSQIEELQAIKKPSQWLAYMLLPLMAASLLGYIAWRERSLWMLVLAVSALIYAVLGATHIRMAAASTLVSTLAFSIGISKLRAFVHLKDASLPMREQMLVAVLIVAVPLQVFGSMGLAYVEDMGEGERIAADKELCKLDSALPLLRSLPLGTILADSNIGPELLFKTSHRIIAGNYHHNVPGLRDSFHLLRSVAPDVHAQDLMLARNIDYVFSCSKIFSNLKKSESERTLAQRIGSSEKIDWLPCKEVIGEWRLYRFER